jgi:Flp pilus assembly protein protease CpaA
MSEPFEIDWTNLQYTAYFAALYPALLGASVIDWRSHQIPNSLVLFVAATGLTYQILAYGVLGIGQAVLGTVLGLVALLPFYLLKGMAAGDVKLMAAVGAWLPLMTLSTAVLLTVLVGGVMGLVFASHRALRASHEGVPYAGAIAAGTLLATLYPGFS